MKTIAIFSANYLPNTGGIEIYTYNMAKKLAQKGYNIIIVTSQRDEGIKKEKNEFFKIYRLPIFKIFSNRYPINKINKEYKKIMKELENENIDSIIIQNRFWILSLLGANFAYKNKIPACIIEHGSGHFTVNNKLLDFFGKIYEHILTLMIKSKVKDFYGVSKQCVEWLKHFKIKAKGIFYNSVDIEECKEKDINKENEKIIITYGGRVFKEKGILELIESFKLLRSKYANIELNIAGDGILLNRIIEENKNEERINILGKMEHDEILKLFAKTSIFVNPTYFSEGLPTTVLEAGFMECIIISTGKGGTKEVIEDGKNGYICECTVNDIYSKIENVINNIKENRELGKKVKNTIIEKFSWDKTVKTIEENIKFK